MNCGRSKAVIILYIIIIMLCDAETSIEFDAKLHRMHFHM